MRVLPVFLALPLLAATIAGNAGAQPAAMARAERPDRAGTAIRLERTPDRAPPSAQWAAPSRHVPAASAMRPPADTGIVRQVEIVPRQQTVNQYLERRGVVADRPTVEAFRAMNPQVSATNRIPAQTRVSAFVPEAATSRPATALQPRARVDMAQAARYTAAVEVDRTSLIQAKALQLPPSAYRRPIDIDQHRNLLASVDSTARLVAQRAPALPSRELALSRYYLRNANGVAQQINAQAATRPIGEPELQKLADASRPVQAMQARMVNGQKPLEFRQITVKVRGDDGKDLREPLRVYVLPAGLVEQPDDPELILELLTLLSFERPTSPSTGEVQRGEMRLWVGPDFRYREMADLVMARGLTNFMVVHGQRPDASDSDLLFMAPSSITVPPVR